jgi:hypothetical protein
VALALRVTLNLYLVTIYIIIISIVFETLNPIHIGTIENLEIVCLRVVRLESEGIPCQRSMFVMMPVRFLIFSETRELEVCTCSMLKLWRRVLVEGLWSSETQMIVHIEH